MFVNRYDLTVHQVLLCLTILGGLFFSALPAWAGTTPDNRIFAELLVKYNHNGMVDYVVLKRKRPAWMPT